MLLFCSNALSSFANQENVLCKSIIITAYMGVTDLAVCKWSYAYTHVQYIIIIKNSSVYSQSCIFILIRSVYKEVIVIIPHLQRERCRRTAGSQIFVRFLLGHFFF